MNQPIISLCIPTYGVTEWVFPVLDSIFAQGVQQESFEVVVTDNGNNIEFEQLMNNYVSKYKNLIYKKTDAYMFENQLEALKLAEGKFLKFINHREKMNDGALQRMLDTVIKFSGKKPTIYFANGALDCDSDEIICNNFDDFVNKLGIYVSWTSGVGIWKEDYEKLPENFTYDKISPHSAILFSERKKDFYVVSNYKFSTELSSSHANKGHYDLFKTFAIEEPMIALKLYLDGDISVNTFKNIKMGYGDAVARWYYAFCVKKEPCSYDISKFDDAMGVFFSKKEIMRKVYRIQVKDAYVTIRHRIYAIIKKSFECK